MPNDTQDWSQKVDVDTNLSGALEVELSGDGEVSVANYNYYLSKLAVRYADHAAYTSRTIIFLNVPDGQRYEIDYFAAWNSSSIATKLEIYGYDNAALGDMVVFKREFNVPINQLTTWDNKIIIDHKYSIRAYWTGVTVGSYCYVSVLGHRLKDL